MGKYCYYDEVEKVIFVDLTGLSVETSQIVDEVVDEGIGLAKTLPKKVFQVVCWKNVTMSPIATERYGERLPELMKYLSGIVRYDATEVTTRIAIRSMTVTNNIQKAKAHIYSSKEEALAVVRRLEQEQLQN